MSVKRLDGTVAHVRKETVLIKTIINKCSSFCAEKKENWLGFFFGLQCFSCSMRWEKVRECCPVHGGYLSCSPNDFWEMQKCIFISAARRQLCLLALRQDCEAKLCKETQAVSESPTERLPFFFFFFAVWHMGSHWTEQCVCLEACSLQKKKKFEKKIQIRSKLKTSCFIMNAQRRSIDLRKRWWILQH